MRVLFLAHRLPFPPNKGERIRAGRQIGALREAGHQVHLIAFSEDSAAERHAASAAQTLEDGGVVVERVLLNRQRALVQAFRALASGEPLSFGYFSSPAMHRQVARAVASQPFDAIVASSAAMAQYVPSAFTRRGIVDLIDVDSEKWREYARLRPAPGAWLYRLEGRRVARAERAIVGRFAHSIVSTSAEAALLDDLPPLLRRDRLHAIGNGVDLVQFRAAPRGESPIPRLPPAERAFLTDTAAPLLVFAGTMSYWPNVDGARYFAERILPLVRDREPGARLLVVGHQPNAAVRRLGQRASVAISGAVEDVAPYLQAATVCVLPLRVARGIQNKLLEGLASSCAVVATPPVATGVAVIDGEHVLLADSPSRFADAVVRVIRDQTLRARLGVQGRGFVEREHRWAPHLARFVSVVESVAAPAPAAESPRRGAWEGAWERSQPGSQR